MKKRIQKLLSEILNILHEQSKRHNPERRLHARTSNMDRGVDITARPKYNEKNPFIPDADFNIYDTPSAKISKKRDPNDFIFKKQTKQ
jgi:hypothetical protein